MKRSLLYASIFTLALAGPLQAQTLSPGFSDLLDEQGFVVLSKRYTWLGRIVVTVSNGLYEREILLTRGSNQILQDNWTTIEQAPVTDTPSQTVIIGGESSRGGPGPGGPGGPGGAGGPGGPGGQP
ncbi:hypothetical protein IMCC20628_01499 [Hoeflea sp. IMCC20628]|uniref:hypothetical protein n=1 Tax=Hoeflea sp. IMCC20628 TaxID=1620421 RepID=UPI00063AA3A4|nr:hypothetical protein [Hoeflea sp. IMCC20628]AKI00216.1 hypothetical protein IMCC20628_01499 [Hoeflea sp. IMCC20628]